MRYKSDELRDKFHKSGTMLQVICHLLENFCYQFGHQVDFVDIEELAGSVTAVLTCEAMNGNKEACLDIAAKINSQFKRTDHANTCVLIDPDVAQFRIFITSANDLEWVH